jgi:hypothetical protein
MSATKRLTNPGRVRTNIYYGVGKLAIIEKDPFVITRRPAV